MTNGKSPVDTLLKVNKFLDGIVKGNAKYGKKENIDILVLIDQITKKAEKFLKINKKLLPIDLSTPEINGTIGRAEYAERPIQFIDPKSIIKEVSTKEEFYSCVKVVTSELKKFIPEARIKEISCIKGTTSVISLKMKG